MPCHEAKFKIVLASFLPPRQPVAATLHASASGAWSHLIADCSGATGAPLICLSQYAIATMSPATLQKRRDIVLQRFGMGGGRRLISGCVAAGGRPMMLLS